jgi:hypothetical protein
MEEGKSKNIKEKRKELPQDVAGKSDSSRPATLAQIIGAYVNSLKDL